jgi:hypothetical protein
MVSLNADYLCPKWGEENEEIREEEGSLCHDFVSYLKVSAAKILKSLEFRG